MCLAERGFGLRALLATDQAWLGELYASTRSEEMALVPWPQETKRQFLEQQRLFQHRHYTTHYPNATYLAIEHEHLGPVGNLYLLQAPPEHLLIHISLLPGQRNQGVGTALIRQCQAEAAATGSGLQLHVQENNVQARRLYERLGFVARDVEGLYRSMHWSADTPGPADHRTPTAHI